jgi:hypothetical protein
LASVPFVPLVPVAPVKPTGPSLVHEEAINMTENAKSKNRVTFLSFIE